MPSRPRRRDRRLTAEAWEDAALKAMVKGGVAAVAIEPVARQLKVTKGSFYWHFRSRDALLRAALTRWARRETEAVIMMVERATDPLQRVGSLFSQVMSGPPGLGALELAISDAAGHPVVGPILRRVARRRIDYLYDCFRALGFAPDGARYRSVLTYSAYVGARRLTREVPDRYPKNLDHAAYSRHVMATLITAPPPQSSSTSTSDQEIRAGRTTAGPHR